MSLTSVAFLALYEQLSLDAQREALAVLNKKYGKVYLVIDHYNRFTSIHQSYRDAFHSAYNYLMQSFVRKDAIHHMNKLLAININAIPDDIFAGVEVIDHESEFLGLKSDHDALAQLIDVLDFHDFQIVESKFT